MGAVKEATRLTFRSDIRIDQNSPEFWRVGSLRIPCEVFLPMENGSELILKDPWHLDPGMRKPDGFNEFQRRISSDDKEDNRSFFIPASYLLGPLEK